MSNAAASTSATASSSKRPATSSPSSPAAKRARSSTREASPEDDDHHDDDGEIKAEGEDMDDEARMKAARKEARTIRNRESAQRSRNQRKAHLAWLEQRVVELEQENRCLRSGTAPSSPSKTREASPANSVLSLASDLGIPPEIVSAGGGVNLATVAPPSAEVLEDIKPVLNAPAAPTLATVAPEPPMIQITEDPANDLRTENAALRWRVGMLENIVKQAATFFSYHNPADGRMPQPHPMANMVNAANPAPFVATTPQPTPGMDTTLSPPLYPTQPREAVQSPLHLQAQLEPTTIPNHVQPTNVSDTVASFVDLSNPVARHPAAVATKPVVSSSSKRRGAALQRATGSLSGINLDSPVNRQRLAVVARASFIPIDAAHAAGHQDHGASANAWFPEGTQAAEWDEEMNDLLETLEGSNKPNGVAPVVPGGAVGVVPTAGEEWTWEAALVEF